MSSTVHLFHSPLWVNVLWRTTLFKDAPQYIDTPTTITTDRLEQCVFLSTFSPSLIKFLVHISGLIDKFVTIVAADTFLAANLALRPPLPEQPDFCGYSTPHHTKLITDCLFRCVFLDRVLWAHDILSCELVQTKHSITEFHHDQLFYNCNHLLDSIKKTVASSNAAMGINSPWSNQAVFHTVSQISALQGALHDVASEVHQFISKMFYALTGTLYCLDDQSGVHFLHLLQNIQNTRGTINEIPKVFIDSIINVFGNLNWARKKVYYFLWFYSVTSACLTKFPATDKDTSQVQFLQKTAIPISQISNHLLSAERAIIKYLITMLGSVLSQVENQSAQMSDSTNFSFSSEFSTLIKELNLALSHDGVLDIKTIPFPTKVDGFRVYTFPILHLPHIFFSPAESRAQNKADKRIRDAMDYAGPIKKKPTLRLSDGDDGIHVQFEPTTPPPSTPPPNSHSQSGAQAQSETQSHNDTQSQSETQDQTQAQNEMQTQNEMETQNETPTQSETHGQDQTQAQNETQTQNDTQSRDETQGQSQTQGQDEMQTRSGLRSKEKHNNSGTGKTKPPDPSLKLEQRRKKKLAEQRKKAAKKRKEAERLRKEAERLKKAAQQNEGQGANTGDTAAQTSQKQKRISKEKIKRYLARPPSNPKDYIDLTETLKTVDIIDLTLEDYMDYSLLGDGPKLKEPDTKVVQHGISVWVPTVDPAGDDDPFGKVLFQRETLEIPFTNHSYPFSDLTDWLASCGMSQNEPPPLVSFCTVISKTKFEALSIQQQRKLWRQGNIHVFNDGASYKLASMSSSQILRHLGVSMVQVRFIYESQRATSIELPMTGMRRDSLLSLFSLSSTDILDCNVLDIPLPYPKRYSPPECLAHLSTNHELSGIKAPIEIPYDSLQWCLLATPPSRTDIHIDAGKFHTWIQPQNGMKFWMVQEPLPEVEEVNTLDMDEKIGKWYGIILRPGDVLIMRANTNHRVVTLQESVTIGGHFYSVDNLGRTMLAGLRENLWGHAITNTTHHRSEGMIYRLALFLGRALGMMVSETSNQEADLFTDEDRERFSVPAELELHVFPPLIFMLLYPEKLIPRSEHGTIDSGPVSKEIVKLRKSSRNLAYHMLKLKPHLTDQVSNLHLKKLIGQAKK